MVLHVVSKNIFNALGIFTIPLQKSTNITNVTQQFNYL